MNKQLFNSWSKVLKERWGKRVHKISLDIGASCPHRKNLRTGGCIFCDFLGGGSGASLRGETLKEQIEKGFQVLTRRYKTDMAILYFQSYSSTNLPLNQLEEKILYAIEVGTSLGKVKGLSVGARPDQVPEKFLDFLASLASPDMEIWLELGIQTIDPAGLKWLNRGHDFDAIERALGLIKQYEQISLCAHLIAGIPGEGSKQLAISGKWLCENGVRGLKFHPLHVLKNTPLESLYLKKEYEPLSMEEYIKRVAEALRYISPDTIIQRLTADASLPRLVAPEWVSKKMLVIEKLKEYMERQNIVQGDLWGKSP